MPPQIATEKTPLTTMTARDATAYSDAITDVLCWFNGFLMGKGEDAEMPPGWRCLRSLGADLKEHASKMQGGAAPQEIPF